MKDIKHVVWLLKGMVKAFARMDYEDFMECYWLIKIHLKYKHSEVK